MVKSIGIVQEGDAVLTQPTQSFELPEEVAEAREIVTALHAAADRAALVHTFSKGMGVAAPQIGVGRRAARRRGCHRPLEPVGSREIGNER
ncbi:peptide deformylase [Streptomyces sp. NBC_00124]|uniref:peptide deformylase n=1 Tax=Streptomyces sp. NBC_00124 TaxID=2975662 RepID=UPI002B1D3E4A|nr:peptide deformylase [Streptomyces sp. NBC_00124]